MSARREKAIRDILHRSVDKLDEWMCSGILGSLKIPLAWVNDAKVHRIRASLTLKSLIRCDRHCMPSAKAKCLRPMNYTWQRDCISPHTISRWSN